MVEVLGEINGDSTPNSPRVTVAGIATLHSVEVEHVREPVEDTIFIDPKLPEQLIIPQYALPDQAETVTH